MKNFEIVSLNVSDKKGISKTPVEKFLLQENYGVVGDAHAGSGHRQVSLLAMEDLELMRKKHADIKPGDLAENLTTRGIDLANLPVGKKITIGKVELEITQIGKKCHSKCNIATLVGECIMPKRGVFAKVLNGGELNCQSIGSYHAENITLS